AFLAGRGEHGRTQATVVAQRHALAALALDQRAERAADGARIGGMDALADDATDVVLAQDGRVELVGRLGHAMLHWISCAAEDGLRLHRQSPGRAVLRD